MNYDKKEPFLPTELPPKNISWDTIIPLIGKAHAGIAKYDGLLQSLINPAVLLSPLITNEAVISSRIEGTQASLEDVLALEAGVVEEKSESIKQDIREIINYRKALLEAEQALKNRLITLSLIKQIHSILMKSARGENKNPGEFRKVQNWIGTRGTPIENARFIPPNPILIDEYMEKLVAFMDSDYLDKIVQLSIIHAQFEIVHPFLDGNGRIGRLLISLFLYSKKILSRPMFYMSEYLEMHRQEYYDRLLGVSEHDDWQSWIEYFLNAVIVQSEKNSDKALKILKIYKKLKEKFIEVTHSKFAVPLLDAFFNKPVIDSSTALKYANIPSRVTGNALLTRLEKRRLIVLFRKGRGRNPSVYILPELINIVEDKKIF